MFFMPKTFVLIVYDFRDRRLYGEKHSETNEIKGMFKFPLLLYK